MAINTSTLKSYAPQARRDFITAVKTRAARFGITEGGSASIQEQGDVAIINGQAYPRIVARQCRNLEIKIRIRGFDAVMEEVAYTWFNRFAAIRYMELHGYFDHGFRVLSHPAGETTPEIVQHAEKVVLPGLKAARVVELKLDGRRDEALFRMLLVAQCNALHAAMPFLFERIDDETELLLPDNLLHSDSIVRQMVERIAESDWQEIEIIGWLYQFYISEKKDQVIGKVVRSEDIPAATQLFTPNWIVKYMVQNSLGAKWLATYPNSPIKAKMEYYIEPAEQPEEVRRQIQAETPDSLDPEELTFLDPANGSGHILVEAYDLFKEIYLERGYRLRDIPRLILEKNLYGLDIDDRAAQMSGFSLIMKARADDRRILSSEQSVRMNVWGIQESDGLLRSDIESLLRSRNAKTNDPASDAIDTPAIASLISAFSDGKTFGSLIKVPSELGSQLAELSPLLDGRQKDLMANERAGDLLASLLSQASVLSRQYDVVVANPPYMDISTSHAQLKRLASRHYPNSGGNLFSMFIERAVHFANSHGIVAMVTMQAWMFLSSYSRLREDLITTNTILSMAHLGEKAFDTIGGSVVSTTMFALRKGASPGYVGSYVRLTDVATASAKDDLLRAVSSRETPADRLFLSAATSFRSIPGAPLSYWVSDALRAAFDAFPPLSNIAEPRKGMVTADNPRFVRTWAEVSLGKTGFGCETREAAQRSGMKWFPYLKGGTFRRWYGNRDFVVNFRDDGHELMNMKGNGYKVGSTNHNLDYIFSSAITWTKIASGPASFRWNEPGFLFDDASGLCPVFDKECELGVASLLNTPVVYAAVGAMNPTLNLYSGTLANIPVHFSDGVQELGQRCIDISKADWDAFERSWNFGKSPLLSKTGVSSLRHAYDAARARWSEMTADLKELEERINRRILQDYHLELEMPSSVSLDSVSIDVNPRYRYGAGRSDADLEVMLRADTVREFISYSVGCMLGRYSLDEPGLILANQGDTLADYLSKVPNPSFVADADNIIPMLDDNWFEDDVTDRFLEFLKVAFGTEHFDENVAFVENVIGKDIRKFFKRDFFGDHLKRYKRRPIYWVFSSGKEKAFEAIVYMHRYNESTLARMRMNYVVPLQSQMANRIERLATELSGANLSSAERKRKDTQRAKLIKQSEELGRFEEELRHLADKRIRIDLDDGVKVNYGKFGNLLAEVKAVTGGGDD